MKSFLILLSIFAFHLSALAQDAWFPELTLGFTSAQIDESYKARGLSPSSFFVDFSECWNRKHEQSFSVVKAFGIGLNYHSLSTNLASPGGESYYSGGYVYSTFNLSLMAQQRFGKSYFLQFGPRFETILLGYENLKYHGGSRQWDGLNESWVSKEAKIAEFNRNYFNNPYYGLSLRLINEPEEESLSAGIGVSYLRTEPDQSNFNSEHMVRVSFILKL
ncbi:hypothetical protein [Sunxiuqinia indica]|uniref:hypothetical protein n=1 Tax=Sunxiuqinia indica TaxID=2692584 RepID=UPI00135BD7FF|nr:hypothetical protein [Sunxiuqinia indica]